MASLDNTKMATVPMKSQSPIRAGLSHNPKPLAHLVEITAASPFSSHPRAPAGAHYEFQHTA
jgi:hypothetical protein